MKNGNGNNDATYEAQARETGRYLNNIPGLTPQRLGELYRGVLHVTQDPHATAEVTYFARGGMSMVVEWTQASMPQRYAAILTAEEVAGNLTDAEDTLFTTFATRTLDAVRELRNAVLEIEAAGAPTAGPDFTNKTVPMLGLVGAVRAGLHESDPPTVAPPADATTEGES